MNLLSIERLEARYGAIQALKGVDLAVRRGEIVALIGANGAGKTTLMASICGTPKPSGGDIRLDGELISGLDSHEIAARHVAISPEGRRVFPRMSVLENLQMGAWQSQAPSLAPKLDHVFTLFPRLAERRAQKAGTMSGGEQQMLAIGRALMSDPKLLLLDEPSLGLAPQISKAIFAALKSINEEFGVTILLAEQDAYHALRLANRAYVLVTGKIVLEGNARELLGDPAIRAAYLEGGHH